jgi:hypothetical protein
MYLELTKGSFMSHESDREKYESKNYYIDIPEFKELYSLNDDLADDLMWLKPFVSKKIFQIMNRFYKYHASSKYLSSFFENDAMRQHVKAATSKMILEYFEGDFSETYFKKNTLIGLTHFRIGLPPYYYEAAMSYLKSCIFEEIKTEISENEHLRAYKAIDAILKATEVITIKSCIYCLYQNALSLKENMRSISRVTFHDIANQTSILDGILNFLRNDPTRLDREMVRIGKARNKIMDKVNLARTLMDTREDLSVTEDLEPFSLIRAFISAEQFLYTRLVPKKSYYKIEYDESLDFYLNGNAYVVQNELIVVHLENIINRIPGSTTIKAILTHKKDTLSVNFYSNNPLKNEPDLFNIPKFISYEWAKLTNVEISEESTLPPATQMIGKKELIFDHIGSMTFKDVKVIEIEE